MKSIKNVGAILIARQKTNNHGITLIALVVTIIVLLILAGVSLNLIAGSNGILGRATNAVNQTKQAAIEEQLQLKFAEWVSDYYMNGTELEGRSESVAGGATITYSGGMIVYEDENGISYAMTASEAGISGSLQSATESQYYNSCHPELHIPTGFEYKEGTVTDGYVITDSTASNKEGGNEFVWIPVASEASYTKKLGKNNRYLSANSSSTYQSQPGTDFSSISEAVTGDILGTSSILGKTVTATIANQPEADIVNAAGGFWVSRYEAGVESTDSADTIGAGSTYGNTGWTSPTKQTIVSKAGVQPVRYIFQKDALTLANSWGSGVAGNGTVAWQSGLITGTQWDMMCKFIGWDTAADYDCRTWGNYGNVTGATYSGYHSRDCSTDWIPENNVVKNGSYTNRWIFPTGTFQIATTNATTAKKNIYDVAGNVWEWTTEQPCFSVNNAVHRGGSASHDGSDHLATYRHGYFSASTIRGWDIGFRFVLYVDIRTELMKAL